jgi:UDP-3-O-[3-hydroxymyristoyl] glucosamine N-acyltransferase
MIVNLSKILELLGNEVKLIKDGKFNSFSLLNGTLKRNNMLLVYIESEEYIPELVANKEITCVICKNEILNQIRRMFDGGIVASQKPRTDFFMFHNYLNRNTKFYKNHYDTRIESSAYIDSSVKIPKKNVIVGKNTKIMAGVAIYENTIIGNNVIIREGSVIGSPAFYYFDYNGNNEAVDSVGGVVIKDNVEIHSNTVVCKGTLGGNTEIWQYSKISSNITVAHDVKIKENCILTTGVKLAGAVVINKGTFIGVGATIVPMIIVGENCKISAGAVVTKNVDDSTQVSGNFAVPHHKYISFIKKVNGEEII